MSLISEIKKSLLLAKADNIEFKGDAPKSSRNICQALMLGTLITAAASPVTSLAEEVKQSLHSVDISTQLTTLVGDSPERYVAKTIGQGIAAKLVTAKTAPWPAQNDKEFYSDEELERQYSAAKELIASLNINKGDLMMDADAIHYYPLRRAAPAFGDDDEARLAGALLQVGESPFSIQPHSLLSEIGIAKGALSNECVVVVPHNNDMWLNSTIKRELYDQLTTEDPQSKTNVFKFLVYHEAAHCFHDMTNDERLHLSNQTEAAIDNGNQLNKNQLDMSDSDGHKKGVDLYATSMETVADSFAALKMEQEYYSLNKEQINNNQLPKVLPLVDAVIAARIRLHSVDSLHDSSPALTEIMVQLLKPGQLDKLEKASNSDLLMTAYAALDKTYAKVIDNAGIIQWDHKNLFPKDYQHTTAPPLFQPADESQSARPSM